MFFRKKLAGKILAIVLAFLLWLNPVVIPLVWAEGEETPAAQETQPPAVENSSASQEESPPPASSESSSNPASTPVPEQPSSQNTEPQPDPTPTPESAITTGEATAQTEVETTANSNHQTVAGEITTPPGNCTPPEGETPCPEDVAIANDNSATVSGSLGSEATTGENQTSGSEGEATINTGNATAVGTMENQVNSNTVILEPSLVPTVTPEVSPEAISPPSEETGLTVEDNNEGTVTNNAEVVASTGENIASENLGDAQIETGDALALLNLLNLLNTNIVGSDFEILFLDLVGGENGEINLNEIWKKILQMDGSDSLILADESDLSNLRIFVQNQNEANLENNVNVQAATGGNQANENNNASIGTGEATALANVTNLVNINLLGSKFFLWVINLLGPYEGNLILPRPEMFASEGNSSYDNPNVIFENQNEAIIEDQVMAEAETGENEENNNQGDSGLVTGDARAVANTLSLVNLNLRLNNWFFLIINNLGGWRGRMFGWLVPGAAGEPGEGSQILQLGLNEPSYGTGENIPIEEDLPLVSFQNQNQASVKNNIQTSASTGQNQANENQGDVQMKTGRARALANLFNLVNLNILGGRWFLGLLNVLGDWGGNVIFAYPDVAVNLSNGSGEVKVGEITEYTVNFQNQGHDEANNVIIRLELPEGVNYLGDSNGAPAEISGRACSWTLGNLGVGEEGSFTITVEVDPGFSFDEPLSFWSKLIPQAHAAENGKEKEVVAIASIETVDPESDTGNNTSSAATRVYALLPPTTESEPEEEGVDQRQPALEISAWNNVGEFVYPGDIVTFEITIRNKGEAPSYDTYLTQALYNGVPEDFGVAELEIGTIEPGKTVRLSFGMALADDGFLPTGHYYTVAQAFGYAPNGNEVSSNEARTDFEIRSKEISSLFEARATGKEEGEILGALNEECQPEKEILPYILLLVLSSMWLTNWGRMRLKKRQTA